MEYLKIKTTNRRGYIEAYPGDGVYTNIGSKRGTVQPQSIQTSTGFNDKGVVIDMAEENMESDTKGLLCDTCGYEKRHQDNRQVLQVLRGKIGEGAFSEWAIGGLWCILSEGVLWEKVYAKSIFENWLERPELVKCSYFGKVGKRADITQEVVRNMWIEWQSRYSSYRRELSEQQFRELKSFVQKLPYKASSSKDDVQDLWETSEGVELLQQALSEIQKIWQPDARWEVQRSNLRIRKLTPLSCWRLMGFDDEDFEKAKAAGISNSQLYKQAGNSIVVNVLEGVLRNLLINQ